MIQKYIEENKKLQDELIKNRRSEAQKDYELSYIRRQLAESADKIIELSTSSHSSNISITPKPSRTNNKSTPIV